jgi:hypothetical protein
LKEKMHKLNMQADWSNDMKSMQLLRSVDLRDWIVIYPQSKRQACINFVDTYGQVIKSMGIRADPPKE